MKVVRIDESARSLAARAYDQLKRRILDFDLVPGDRLSENELAREIDVSRTPLRQALQRLQQEGLVEAIPKVGWLVPALDFQKFDELYDFRLLIECNATRELCTVQGGRPVLDELEKIWQVPAKERLRDAGKVSALDEAFHIRVVESLGNREMSRAHAEITARIRIIRRLDFTQENRVSATYSEHSQILSAIRGRNADTAQSLLSKHVNASKREVRKITLGMLETARREAISKKPGAHS
jgi:DNA-binding GntR family transcriptional regulator